MPRNRTVSPPPEFSEEGKVLWRAAVRQLQQQGTWRPIDGPLLESYVQSVLSARAMRAGGQHDMAAVAERDAAARAGSLLLTPASRARSNGKASPVGGLIEGTS